MEIGDFTVWGDPETMTTTVSVDGRTEQVTQAVGEMLEILGRYVTRLQAENAKLRELASILCFCMQIHKHCADCKLDGTKGELGHDPLLACRELHAMLRELGVELDKWAT